ncbi:MAG: SBBP repeat-containing protein [Planctomycetota bacterium]|nr:SBBP repeat-containing protein [Planctomycetota bacterium]
MFGTRKTLRFGIVAGLALVSLILWRARVPISRTVPASSRANIADRPPVPIPGGSTAVQSRLNATYGRLPLTFERNDGQVDGEVKFLSRGSGYTLFLTEDEAVLSLRKPGPKPEPESSGSLQDPLEQRSPPPEFTVMRMKLVRAQTPKAVVGLEEMEGKSNYFIGNDPARWRTDVPHYGKVRYEKVYPGVDLVYYGNQTQLEYDFVVAPGADPALITLSYEGVDNIEVTDAGELLLHAKGGVLRQHKPIVYQETEGGRREIDARYVLSDAKTVAFDVAAHDRQRPLVIDPVLVYSTYLGGGSDDGGGRIAVGSSGNAYVGGTTSSTNFPTAGPFQAANAGSNDVFIVKLNAAGTALVYCTYLGGSGSDTCSGIALDGSGNAYVTGVTQSANFPTVNAFQSTHASMPGAWDSYVAKLNAAGNALVYSTYLGGGGQDVATNIAVDGAGNACVAGRTSSSDYPTANAFQAVAAAPNNLFVTKLNAAGTALIFSTFLGGSNEDAGGGIAVDASGDVYVAGYTFSTDFPTLNPFQGSSGGSTDAFVTKLRGTGNSIIYSTYLGGSGTDSISGIAVDAAGSAYVVGNTTSTSFPIVNAVQPAYAGNQDVFVAKLNPAGNALVFSTYLGGTGADYNNTIAIDGSGNVHVTGRTLSTDFPTANALQTSNAGGADLFVVKLAPSGNSFVYSTYLGGSGEEAGGAIAVDGAGNAYVTGQTASTNFPTVSALQASNAGGNDAIIVKIAPTPSITSPKTAQGTQSTSFSYSITATESPTSYGATGLPSGLSVNTSTGVISGTPSATGTFSVTISATNSVGTGSATLTITVAGQAPAITSTLTATGTVGQGFSYEIQTSGTTPIAFSAQPLPAGLSLSGGTISGTPTTEGATDVTLGASNSAGSDSKVLRITVNPSGAPAITSALTATSNVGTAFSYKIAASGNAPITFNATNLPPGLSFSGDTISGTPPATGKTSVTISASNNLGTDTKTLEITINAAGAPMITSSLSQNTRAGQAFSYEITATGNGPITFDAIPLPGWLTRSGAVLSGTPASADVGTTKITVTATNSAGSDSQELSITVAPAVGDPPVITDILRSRNPVRTNTDVTLTAEAVSPSGQPLTFSWFFFLNGVQEGQPVAGQTITYQFPNEGQYTVVAIAFDGFSKSSNFTKVSVTLAPNSGSTSVNVTTGDQAVNPASGLGITVSGSMGGVVDIDVVEGTPRAAGANETFTTRLPALGDFDGRNLAGKFSLPQIFVVETTGTQVGGATRTARMMVPVSGGEAGKETTVVDQRANTGLVTFDMKGKFNFGQKLDGVTLKSEIELPAGLSLKESQSISVGIGNVTANGAVDCKGRVTGLSAGNIKKVQVKWPRLDKTNPVTKGGEKAKVTISMKGTSLDSAGFDTEGVVNTGLADKVPVPRDIQTAVVVGGVSYYAQAKVNYTLKKGTGMLQGRTPR